MTSLFVAVGIRSISGVADSLTSTLSAAYVCRPLSGHSTWVCFSRRDGHAIQTTSGHNRECRNRKSLLDCRAERITAGDNSRSRPVLDDEWLAPRVVNLTTIIRSKQRAVNKRCVTTATYCVPIAANLAVRVCPQLNSW